MITANASGARQKYTVRPRRAPMKSVIKLSSSVRPDDMSAVSSAAAAASAPKSRYCPAPFVGSASPGMHSSESAINRGYSATQLILLCHKLARVTPVTERAAVCLTGGSSPEGLYQRLAREPYRSKLPWGRVHWFMGDDRFVPGDHTHSNMGMARRFFLDRVTVPAGNIHPIPTDADSPHVAARHYEAELKRFYGRDRFA